MHSILCLAYGGVQVLTLNVEKRIQEEYSFIYLIDYSNKKDKEFIEANNLNYKTLNICEKSSFILKAWRLFWFTYRSLKQLRPQIYHINDTYAGTALVRLTAARLAGIKTVVHSHQSFPGDYLRKMKRSRVIANRALGIILSLLSDQLVACSKQAADWMFGYNNTNKLTIVKNGINLNKFVFCADSRERTRNKLGIDKRDYVIGHVGRFDEQKNHKMLIEIFATMQRNRQNLKLLLIGNGDLFDTVYSQIIAENMIEKVIIIKETREVEQYLCAMDLFLFPSLYEGFGIAAIEAQVSGLVCMLSNAVPDEAVISKRASIINNKDPVTWIRQALIHVARGFYSRNVDIRQFELFSIEHTANSYKDIYRRVLF